MVSVLVTGANRGIGFGLVQQLVLEPTVDIVIATARNIEKAEVSEIVGDKGLDILINNAGILLREKLDGDLTKDVIMEQLEVNTVAPLMIATRFRALLKQAADVKGSAQIANISSLLGSLELAPLVNLPFPNAIYSISKTALNMVTRKLAIEWKPDGIRATAFSPGWVETDMGTEDGQLTLEESTVPLAKRILELSEEHNGLFYAQSGKSMPW